MSNKNLTSQTNQNMLLTPTTYNISKLSLTAEDPETAANKISKQVSESPEHFPVHSSRMHYKMANQSEKKKKQLRDPKMFQKIQ